MEQQAKHFFTPAEYLAMEETADYKSEYFQGEIFAMAGGSSNHNVIAGNISRDLGNSLEAKPCQVYIFDMRLLVDRNELYTYPDVMVICGNPEFAKSRNDTVTNPILIVEVLSPSTREYDRVKKFALYQALGSLQDYVLVDSERVHVTYLKRVKGSRKWLVEMLDGIDETLILESVACEIPQRRIYNKVVFGNEA